MINRGGNGSILAVAKLVLVLTVPPHRDWAQSLPIHFTAYSAPLWPQPHITEWPSLACNTAFYYQPTKSMQSIQAKTSVGVSRRLSPSAVSFL